MPRRSYGTGSLFEHRGAWYGRWYIGDRRVKRKVGPKRAPGTREGLTRSQAEQRLRRIIDETAQATPAERLTVKDAGERCVDHLDALGRKRSTIETYRSILTEHLAGTLGDKPLQQVDRTHVEVFIAGQRRRGQSPKSIRNQLGLLHSIFTYAQKNGWVNGNPVKLVDKPSSDSGDQDVRFLEPSEVEALIRAVPADTLGPTEHALYLTAAMTGLRQGELIALRWRDVDWTARRIRVRRNYVRGQYGSPKSKRSTRSVPLIDRLGGELERHYQLSVYQHDDDLVFAHPHTGNPLDRSKVLKRFKAACSGAHVRPVRFHDLRHTFGTRMAGAGVPLRTLQEWMGHRDFKTTLIYADYQPSAHEADLAERAFAAGPNSGPNLSETESNPEHLTVPERA